MSGRNGDKPRSIKSIAMRDRGVDEAEAERISRVIHRRRQERLGQRIRAARSS